MRKNTKNYKIKTSAEDCTQIKCYFSILRIGIFLTILMSIDVKYFKLCVYTIKLSKTKIWALANFGVEPFAKGVKKLALTRISQSIFWIM